MISRKIIIYSDRKEKNEAVIKSKCAVHVWLLLLQLMFGVAF